MLCFKTGESSNIEVINRFVSFNILVNVCNIYKNRNENLNRPISYENQTDMQDLQRNRGIR